MVLHRPLGGLVDCVVDFYVTQSEFCRAGSQADSVLGALELFDRGVNSQLYFRVNFCVDVSARDVGQYFSVQTDRAGIFFGEQHLALLLIAGCVEMAAGEGDESDLWLDSFRIARPGACDADEWMAQQVPA